MCHTPRPSFLVSERAVNTHANLAFTHGVFQLFQYEPQEPNNNKVQVFSNQQFGEIRTTVINGEPWFVGKDVAERLGYSNTADAILKHIDEEDRLESQIAISGQNRKVILINESGLYSLVLRSNLPTAKAKHWLINQQTNDFLQELAKVRNLTLTDLVHVKKGGHNAGTWMHQDVALEFARWLSPKFAIWCNDRIKELLTTGVTTVSDDGDTLKQGVIKCNICSCGR